jgi:hypothetical protein
VDCPALDLLMDTKYPMYPGKGLLVDIIYPSACEQSLALAGRIGWYLK